MKRSPLKKRSPVPLSRAKRLLLEDVKRLVRESGGCAAEGQGNRRCGGGIQASHVKSEGAYKNLFVDPQNMIPMCWVHHFFWWHKEPTEAGTWFKEAFPLRSRYLESVKKRRVDWTVAAIAELRTTCARGLRKYEIAYARMMGNAKVGD